MLPYWLIFIMAGWMAMSRTIALRSSASLNDKRWGISWLFTGIALTLMIGLRYEVGADWGNYLPQVENAAGLAFIDVIRDPGDPAYSALNWLGANIFGGIFLVNTVCAFLFAWGLISFCRAQPLPWLALVVAVPYLIIVVAMGYTRQGVAIGLAMLALTALMKGSVLRFVFWVAVAATFHKSAVILVPIATFSGSKYRWLTVVGVLVSAAVLYSLLLEQSTDGFVKNYIEAEYASSGAAIRIAMNALPAVVFLRLRKRFGLTPSQTALWTWISLAALGFVVILAVSPSSTAVDRVALYWIPLQLFVLSRVPYVLGRFGRADPYWVTAIVSYSGAVLFVWLFFAVHAYSWLPYQFYPWVSFWS
jgi:hypothetical protein